MTIYTLISEHEKRHPTSHYFDRETLKFFGESYSTMTVLKATETITDYRGNDHECFVVSSLQRNAPGGAARHYSYFDCKTFEHIIN